MARCAIFANGLFALCRTVYDAKKSWVHSTKTTTVTVIPVMKIKYLIGATLAVAVSLSSFVPSARAVVITTGFGTLPGAAANAYGGSGIPQDTSMWTQISGLPNGDIVTLGQATTQYKSSPVPGNDGVNTYFVETGTLPLGTGGSQRTKWNWDFYGRSDNGTLGTYNFQLTIENILTGQVLSFDPTVIPDNVGGPGAFGNSESFDFVVFGVPIGYDSSLDNTFNISLDAYLNGNKIGGQQMTIVAGNGASVPDGGSSLAMLGVAAGSLGFIRRKLVKS